MSFKSQSDSSVLKCGFMSKQGSGQIIGLWKERYFKLFSNSQLKYYHSPTDANCRAVIDLSSVSDMRKNKSTRFTVAAPSRLWKFRLKSTSERDEWYQQIFVAWNRAIDCNQFEGDSSKISTKSLAETLSVGGFIFHKVTDDETLNDLCSKYNVSMNQMKLYNKDVILDSVQLSAKWILIPSQSDTKCTETLEMNHSQSELTTEHLLKLLDIPDPAPYLRFIYTQLIKLNNDRDDTIIDMVFAKLILKFEVFIQQKVYNMLLQTDCKDHHGISQIFAICESEDKAAKEHKILTHSCEHWKQWRHKQEQNEEIHIRDFAASKCNESHVTMKEKLWSTVLHCIAIRTKAFHQTEPITTWIDDIDCDMKQMDEIEHNLHDVQFPSGYNLMQFYVNRYYQQLICIVMDKLEHTEIENQDKICIISWIESFKTILKNKLDLMNRDRKTITETIEILSRKQNEYMKCYINVSKEKWTKWVQNIVQNECDKRECFIIDNVPRVHCVQDLFTVFNHQLHTVTQKYVLHGSLLNDVVMLILQTLDRFHVLLAQYIDEYCNEFEDKYCCGLINSIYDIVSKLTKYQDELDDDIDEFDERISTFTRLAKQCAIRLSYKICRDALEQNIFEIWFTLKYFKNGSDATDSMILTMKEYMEDFTVWIDEKYFVNVICKQLVKKICDEYIEALLRNKPRTSKLTQCIQNDVSEMNLYFGNEAMFESIWKKRYQYLSAIHFALEIVTQIEDDFFAAYCEILQTDRKYGERLLQYIIKKRKIQRMDHVLSNKVPLRKLKHNKVAKNIGQYIQKRKEKKNQQKKSQNRRSIF